MIEAGANEVPEDKMIEAIFAAHALNQEVIKFIDTIVAECGKPKHSYESCEVPSELWDDMTSAIPSDAMEAAVFTDVKQVREENIKKLEAELEEGAEKAFESYLHGTKGTRIITTNQEGKITGELYTCLLYTSRCV